MENNDCSRSIAWYIGHSMWIGKLTSFTRLVNGLLWQIPWFVNCIYVARHENIDLKCECIFVYSPFHKHFVLFNYLWQKFPVNKWTGQWKSIITKGLTNLLCRGAIGQKQNLCIIQLDCCYLQTSTIFFYITSFLSMTHDVKILSVIFYKWKL